MSNAGAPDVLSGFGDVPADNLRESAAVILKGSGASIEEINAALTARGVPPLNVASVDYAQGQKDALVKDSNFMARYSAGDPAAIAQLYAADLAVINGKGGLLDRAPNSSDPAYDQMKNEVYRNVPGANAETYSIELADLASSIGMRADSAKSLTEDHFGAIRATAGMSPDELSAWGDRETAAFQTAVGDDAKIAEASKTLSAKSGRKLDLNAIARTNGARVAINLYFQSMSTKGVK